ncbi:hypothetical protein OC835_007336 [Tilletia horrida]|nr:hypothetical protein OC835_007336 [Tilletia horrida]
MDFPVAQMGARALSLLPWTTLRTESDITFTTLSGAKWPPSFSNLDNVEAFNLIFTLAAVALIVFTLLWSAWTSATSSVRLDGPVPEIPPTTFDLAKATLEQQKLAVEATVAHYRGTPSNEASFKRAVRWRVRLLTLFSLAAIGIDAFTLVLNGPVATRKGFYPAVAADIALWILLFGITLRPLRTHEGWGRIGQFAALTTVALSTHVVRVLIPLEHASTGADLLAKHRRQLSTDTFQLAAIPVAMLAFATTLTLPSGPIRVFSANPAKEPELQMMKDQDSGASILTMLYAGWCWPMMRKGRRVGYVEESDVPVIGVSMRAAVLHARMTLRNRTQAASKTTAGATRNAWRLLISLFRTNDRLLIIVFIMELVGSAMYYLPPFLLFKIVSTMEESEANHEPRSLSFRRNIVYIVAFFVGQLVQMYAIALASMTSMATLKNRIKAQLNTMLLSKALRRKDFSSPSEKKDAPAAEGNEAGSKPAKKDDDKIDIGSKSKVLALHTMDVQRVLDLVNSSFFLVNGPVEIISGSILLFSLLGIGGFIGLATSIIPIPIVYFVSKYQTRLQDELMEARDARTAALNESMQAIRMIKLSAWEDRMSERVNAPRRKELRLMRILFALELVTHTMGLLSPILIVVTAFVWSTLVEGRKLTPGIAFASFAVLKELRYSIEGLPQVITECLQCFVSLRRVAVYLESPEVDAAPHEVVDGTAAAEAAVSVALHNATVGWPVFAGFGAKGPAPTSPFCLRDVSVNFTANELNLICGRLGSGKTLLLLSLLGEAELLSGRISCPRSPSDAIVQSDNTEILQPGKWISSKMVAYAPQQAVILNGSIQYNILWGLPMDRERYDATVAACGLRPDLAAFEDGDSTEIGEGGIGLSGGQKARVGLARAVYSRAQTVLLDDVLSAVDAHTAAHIHKNLLQGPLLKGRTVLLVSHQVQLVAPTAGLVVVLDDGKLQFKGTSSKFLASEFYSGLVEETEAVAAVAESEEPPAKEDKAEGAAKTGEAAALADAAAASKDGKVAETTATKDPEGARKLVQEEKRERGTIAGKVWLSYYKAAGGTPYVLPVAILVILGEVWAIVPAAWLAALTTDTTRPEGMKHPLTWWMGGYTGLSLLGVIVNAVKMALFFLLSYMACRTIFSKALMALFRAPIRFHDTTPRGRIMNRLGSDVQTVDEQLVHLGAWMTSHIVSFFLSCIVVSVEGSPLFLAIIILLAPAYNWVASCFRVVIRDVRRMGQTAKSPVAQTFTDILSGLAVIRAFGSAETTMQTFYRRLDHNIRFDNLQMHRWSSTAMSTFSAVQLFVAGCLIASNDTTSAATAALALSFLLDLGTHLQVIVSMMGQLEFCMVAVERLCEFAETKPEPAEIVEPRPPAAWPQTGEVEFKDLRVKYAPELPDVLKGVSFTVAGGTKVGIVGPTGCGKSTTVQSLFRFVEFAGGSIEIDGLDISKVGLKDLRSRIQIVPQDPVILSGTLRDAIDVFHERIDAEILDALRKVHLIRSTAPSTPQLNGDANGTAPVGKANGIANGTAEDSNKVSASHPGSIV